MTLLLLSFLAGILTVLAPCVLPILPIIIWGSVIHGHRSRPRVIILSFAVSVFVFTLLLQWLFDQFGLTRELLTMISAIILLLVGLFLLFPQIWQWMVHVTGIERATSEAQTSAGSWLWGDILLGALLGPVFNSCSPTYALVVATILPVSFVEGIIIILAYIVGLCLMLGLIAWWGYKIVNKLKRAANPSGWFRKFIALLIILVGISLLMKRDKQLETRIIDQWWSLDATLREIEQLPTSDYREKWGSWT